MIHDTRVQYQEVELSNMVHYFVKGFTPPEGERVVGHEYFVDVGRGKLLLKLYVEGAALPAPEPRK